MFYIIEVNKVAPVTSYPSFAGLVQRMSKFMKGKVAMLAELIVRVDAKEQRKQALQDQIVNDFGSGSPLLF